MVRPELVRDAVVLAHFSQPRGVQLDVAAAVREHQIRLPAQVLVQVRGDLPLRGAVLICDLPVVARRRQARRSTQVTAQLHVQLLPALGRDDRPYGVAGARAELLGSQPHVALWRAQSYAWDTTAQCKLESVQQGAELCAALTAEEGVELIDDDVTQSSEQGRDLRPAEDEHRLERLGRHEQRAARVVEQALLCGAADVAVPAGDGEVEVLAQPFQPAVLIVDEGLERAEVQHLHAPLAGFGDQRRADRQERCLGLA